MRSFVTATMIAERLCSPRRQGQDLLPQLVAKLITASIPKDKIHEYRFPHGDQVYLHGADGVLAVDATLDHRCVPAGISLWEMGTSMHPKGKADTDFKGAEEKLAHAFPNVVPPVMPDQATLVIVSAKPWDSGTWVRANRTSSKWKGIRVLDAVDLEKWIEDRPGVMLWFAEVCGLPAKGLFDAEQYLRKLSVGFGVSDLSSELVIAGRNEELEALRDHVVNSNSKFFIRGESIEEASAFLAGASLKEPEEYGKKPPVIFADASANLNLLESCGAEVTLVPLDSNALEQAKLVESAKWRLILPEPISLAAGDTCPEVRLPSCNPTTLEQYLIEQMNMTEHSAREIVRDTKGSLIALLWLIGAGPTRTPRWATRKDATTHASLVLVGTWLGNNAFDTRIVERLSRHSYRDIETLLQSSEVPEGPWMHRGTEWTYVSKKFVWSQLQGKITETMLHDFLKIVNEVLCEKDPALDLPYSERNMASILGKTRQYSSALRRGLVDSTARLAVHKGDGQTWANRIVRDILDPGHPEASVRWLSLTDVYSQIAEAAPVVFLDCLEEMIRLDEARQFFQDSGHGAVLFNPTSAHVYLLWALEKLVWKGAYFSRVISILTKLAKIDPSGKTQNRPKNSLVTILLPRFPQHSETMENALQALKTIYSTSSTVGWQVASELLPDSYAMTSDISKPRYHAYLGRHQATDAEHREFIRQLLEIMFEWAGTNATRWASLIKAYPTVQTRWPEVGSLITNALARLDENEFDQDAKSAVHDSLQKLIYHHRTYCDANWALPDTDLMPLENMIVRFEPTDPVLRYSHLFSWRPNVPTAPMKEYQDGWEEWIAQQRVEAVKSIYGQNGVPGICRLAKVAEVSEFVGVAASQLEYSNSEIAVLLKEGLSEGPADYSSSPVMRSIMRFLSCRYAAEGDEWLEALLALEEISWNPNMQTNLVIALPPSPRIWERVKLWGKQVDDLYWRNVEIRGSHDHWPQILEKWSQVDRPWSSFELLAHLVDEHRQNEAVMKPSAEQVIDILESALASKDTPQQSQSMMLSHYCESLFSYLDHQEVAPVRMAGLEWAWLRVLEHTERGVKALYMQVTSSPELFVELLKSMYRAKGEPESERGSEEQQKMAEQAYRVLKGIHNVPGSQREGTRETVDAAVLREWVQRSRELAQECGRLIVCDRHIGQILSHAPSSSDESWPCVEVRDLIEKTESTELESGLRTGKYNQRGVFFRGKGGEQERELAEKYKKLAEMVRTAWPRTGSILQSLSRTYEQEAIHWDEQAKRDEYE